MATSTIQLSVTKMVSEVQQVNFNSTNVQSVIIDLTQYGFTRRPIFIAYINLLDANQYTKHCFVKVTAVSPTSAEIDYWHDGSGAIGNWNIIWVAMGQ